MTVTEFYKERFELLKEDLQGYAPQYAKGRKYIIEPFESLEDWKEKIENDLQEYPYDEELEEDLSKEQEQKLFDELYEEFKTAYNRVTELRKPFLM